MSVMVPVVEKLSHTDMISLAAYISSLKPQTAPSAVKK
jgi:cytochrome c553